MAEFPALPLFTDAIIADTVHLTPEEFGCYMRLLIFCWRTPDCRLPNSDLRLRTMLGLTPKRWQRMKPTLLGFFIEDGDQLLQKKLSKVRRHVAKSVEQKRKAGERSAAARALKRNNTGPTAVQRGGQQNGNGEGNNQNQNQTLSKDKGEADEFFSFWEAQIEDGKRVPSSALSQAQIRVLQKRGNVSEAQLKTSGVEV